VLDEADRMLDMGFKDTIDKIIDSMPLQRQTILFSATFPDQISLIVDRVMKSPVRVATDSVDSDNAIQQFFYMASNDDERMTALRLLLSKHKLQSVLVFCNTKIDVKRVTSELINYGYYAIAIHGDMDQKDRDQALIRFSNNSISILVATDVAARGLDIDSLDMVINFSVANDPETHIHRIGRTGRAGRSGVACTLYDQREKFKLNALKLDIDFDKFSDKLPNIKNIENSPISPKMTTLKIDGGKRQKLRAGDIVGALTGSNGGVPGDRIGKINITSNWSYVAVSSELAKQALKKISNDNLKGRSFRVRIL
jgi:ATP-independent RNA helicase DbpA